jgi:anti-sigma factor RsiW
MYSSQWRFGWLGWATAAVLLLAFAGTMFMQRSKHNAIEQADLVTEVFDQHMATLAGNLPPQVISTDRHTVKPWFQGKLPFSFNLPESLPRDTTLDGANLSYLHNQPVAQLLYSIGKHRVSVFLREKPGAARANELPAEHSGFHVMDFSTDDLEGVAVSDVDPARLTELVSAIRQAQTAR